MYYNVVNYKGVAMSVTSVRLRLEVAAPLEQLSKKLDRSKSYLINQAVSEYLAKTALEEKRWAETLEALDSVKAGRLIDENSVTDWIQSWGTDNESDPPAV